MKAVLITAPSLQPVTYEEVETHLRIDVDASTAESVLVDNIISESVSYVENYTRRALLTQTWDLYLESFPAADFIGLPFGNLQSITYMKYTDSVGTITTMTETTDYIVETNGERCGRAVLAYGASWPSFTAYPSNPIVIRFICGWTSAALVPFPIKAAVKMIASDLYENREGRVFAPTGGAYLDNPIVKDMLYNYRIWEEF